MLGGPTLIGEYRFCTGRKWRFDFALVGLKIALEVEGGVWSGGRHTRGAGYESDCEKYNAATAMGWRVLRFTAKMLQGEGWSERMKDAIAWTLEQRSRYAPCRVEEVTR
ncbi:MAG: hypothetical protein A3E78_09205 [Alphaproteobacteria bacterium RIFCSPHIGHO2_12_FULL_63_12]|nr:MAG: hypothetical protein A3E78_09205 [Alphaproteobacteria bacterium RIFCSPHIGHO2_12_FULL_63_12]